MQNLIFDMNIFWTLFKKSDNVISFTYSLLYGYKNCPTNMIDTVKLILLNKVNLPREKSSG